MLHQVNTLTTTAKKSQKMPFKNLSSDFLKACKNSLNDHLTVSCRPATLNLQQPFSSLLNQNQKFR